jgi:hypothetical protein
MSTTPAPTASISITPSEKAFLKVCLNYKTPEQQRADNYSNGGIEEAAEFFNGNRKAAGGLITSLTQKGLGFLDTEFD